MKWIKVDQDASDGPTLPPLDQIVWIVYRSDYDGGQVVQLGGRAMAEDGWLWGVLDSPEFARNWEPRLYGIEMDDDYNVTHWAGIEWPVTAESQTANKPTR